MKILEKPPLSLPQVLRHRKQTSTEIYVEGNYSDTKKVMKLLEIKNLNP